MSAIKSVKARLFQVPLPEVVADAKHGDHTHFDIITTTVELEDGSIGTGYTNTGGRGGHAVRSLIEYDLAPTITGLDGDSPETVFEAMEWHIHYVGRGGIAVFSMSAFDIALWDIRCR